MPAPGPLAVLAALVVAGSLLLLPAAATAQGMTAQGMTARDMTAQGTSAAPGDRYVAKALRATNTQRARHELRAFRTNRCLVRAARSQARAMAASGKIYHQELVPVLERCRMRTVGENVAVGYRSGRAVVRGWMASPGHRENILRREFRLIGIAAVRGDDGRWYSAQVFGGR